MPVAAYLLFRRQKPGEVPTNANRCAGHIDITLRVGFYRDPDVRTVAGSVRVNDPRLQDLSPCLTCQENAAHCRCDCQSDFQVFHHSFLRCSARICRH